MYMLNKLIHWILKRRLPQIQHFMKKPLEVQEKIFSRLIRSAKGTEWGKIYHFAGLASYENFQKTVPVSSYEDIFPYIQRMMKGEQNILWNSKINWFSKSSGTTNARSKFIPVSWESLKNCHFRGGRDLIALYFHNRPHSKAYLGRGLSIGGTFQKNPDHPQSFYGDISAVVVQNLPKWAQALRTPPLSIAMMDKWEDKIEQMADYTIKKNITSILGVPTWTIVLLKRILEKTGKQHIREVWPNLELFVHGAVSFTPYRDLFNTLTPGINYLETYNASEGFFGIQDDLSRDDMLLMLDYDIFYEFIPLTEDQKTFPKTLTLAEVELNKNYAMIISTSGGLWRYKIGDTVKFTSKNPFRIKVTGRTKQFINTYGEEVIVENAEIAVAAASSRTNAVVSNYTAGPVFMDNENQGGHEWIIEFSKMPDNFSAFVEVLDGKLREINSDYDAKRYKDIALKPPVVHLVPEGTFYNWLKKNGKLGGQHKVPRLSNSRDFLDDILETIRNEMAK